VAARDRADRAGRFLVDLPSGRHPDAGAEREEPGLTIGINGLAGNLGIAVAALVTGFLVKLIGWRAAFVVPGLVSIACGIASCTSRRSNRRRRQSARRART
jgi:predicted MFS family arabinose efflux permease